MKARNAEGKMVRNYQNPFMSLMVVPRKAKRKPQEVFMTCGYCKGSQALGARKALMINGIRLHPDHLICIESAKHPLFDMDERKWKAR